MSEMVFCLIAVLLFVWIILLKKELELLGADHAERRARLERQLRARAEEAELVKEEAWGRSKPSWFKSS